jgi:hypothetical protein
VGFLIATYLRMMLQLEVVAAATGAESHQEEVERYCGDLGMVEEEVRAKVIFEVQTRHLHQQFLMMYLELLVSDHSATKFCYTVPNLWHCRAVETNLDIPVEAVAARHCRHHCCHLHRDEGAESRMREQGMPCLLTHLTPLDYRQQNAAVGWLRALKDAGNDKCRGKSRERQFSELCAAAGMLMRGGSAQLQSIGEAGGT